MPDPTDKPSGTRPKRERSVRYPGASLGDALKLCESMAALGVDGLPAPEIAQALGYKNIKTNTFSAPLSAARQFGLLGLTGDGYALSDLARSILHPVDPSALPRLYREALLKPPLYADLGLRLAGKRVPETPILGNLLYHGHQITAGAKEAAAEAFVESARFAGALGDDRTFRPDGPAAPAAAEPPRPTGPERRPAPGVRIDLELWDDDQGKTIRVRAPRSITPASFERFLQAFRLHVRIEEAK